MAKKKRVLWGRVFAFFGIILTAFVVFLISTNSLPSTTLIRSILKPKAAASQRIMHVLPIAYYPNYTDTTYTAGQKAKVAALNTNLKAAIETASIPKGYKNAGGTPYVLVDVKPTIERNGSSPNVTGSVGPTILSMNAMLTAGGTNLCDYIIANNIDAVWFWKDVGKDTGGFNEEYFDVWSAGLYTGQNPAYMTCNGQRSFEFFGFEQNRTEAQALHSIGHAMEGKMYDLQGQDLFWTKWTGGQNRQTLAPICGNIHFPPNTGTEYDWTNTTNVSTSCPDWKPDGTGAKTIINCGTWGCSEGGYVKWWFQNIPSANNGLTYSGKNIPNWWDLFIDIDNGVSDANKAGQWITPQFSSFFLASTPTPVATALPTPTGTPFINLLGPDMYCTPQTISASTCTSTRTTTCGTWCKGTGGEVKATCASGSDCLAPICLPKNGDRSVCPTNGTQNNKCYQPCRASSDCDVNSECTVIVPLSQPIVQPGTSYTVKLVNKPTGSAQNYFIFDGMLMDGQMVEENQLALYSGNWQNNPSTSYSGGYAKYTTGTGDSIEFGTTARTLKIVSVTHPNVGSVDVYVNGNYRGNVVMTAPTTAFQQQFDITPLLGMATPTPAPTRAPTPVPTAVPTATPVPTKTIKLVNHAIDSTRTCMDFDALIENGQNIEETSTRFTYGGGTWYDGVLAGLTNGKNKYNCTNGAYVTFTTTAVNAAYYATKATNMGSVDLYINGVKKANVVMTAASTLFLTPVSISGFY